MSLVLLHTRQCVRVQEAKLVRRDRGTQKVEQYFLDRIKYVCSLCRRNTCFLIVSFEDREGGFQIFTLPFGHLVGWIVRWGATHVAWTFLIHRWWQFSHTLALVHIDGRLDCSVGAGNTWGLRFVGWGFMTRSMGARFWRLFRCIMPSLNVACMHCMNKNILQGLAGTRWGIKIYCSNIKPMMMVPWKMRKVLGERRGWWVGLLLLVFFYPPPSPTPPRLCKMHELWNTSLLHKENSTMGARPKV